MSSNYLEAPLSCERSVDGDNTKTSQNLLHDCDMKGAGSFNVSDLSKKNSAEQFLPSVSFYAGDSDRDPSPTLSQEHLGQIQNTETRSPDASKRDTGLTIEDLKELQQGRQEREREERERQEQVREQQERWRELHNRERRNHEREERDPLAGAPREELERKVQEIERELQQIDRLERILEERNRIAREF